MLNLSKASGRSMIEMLGVLAIIGVLSAGGIMGYTTAMENYRVNKTIEDMRLYGTEMGRLFNNKTYPASYTTTTITESLYHLGILPSYPLKGFWKDDIRFSHRECPNYCTCLVKNVLDYYIPAPCKYEIIGFADSDKLPLSACVKLFTHNWQDSGFLYMGPYFDNSAKYYNFPLSVSEAETVCKTGLAGIEPLAMLIVTHGRKVPN